MAGGRPRKPAKILKFEGGRGKRAPRDDEPEPTKPRRIPPPPDVLDRNGKTEWRRMARTLHNLGLLTGLDRGMLTLYCQAYSIWRRAVVQLNRDGLFVLTPSGHSQQHAALAVITRQVQTMVRIGTEFGLSPASRTRITAAAPS